MSPWIWAAVLLILICTLLFAPAPTPPAEQADGGSLKLINEEHEARPHAIRLAADYEGGVRARVQLVDNGLTTFMPEENCLSH